MALAKRLKRHLERRKVAYRTVRHPETPSASRTAEASHISGEKIAKGVLLKDEDGYTLAVLPASHHVRLGGIATALATRVGLASEDEVAEIFTDCARGAIPAVGDAYGLNVVVDERLIERDEVYFEGGDHATLVRVSAAEFGKLMADARRTRFAEHD